LINNFKNWVFYLFILTSILSYLINKEINIIFISLIIFIFGFLIVKTIEERIAIAFALMPFTLMPIKLGPIFTSVPDLLMIFVILNYYLTNKFLKKNISHFGLIVSLILITTSLSFLFSSVKFLILGSFIKTLILFIFIITIDKIKISQDQAKLYLKCLSISFPIFIIVLIFNGDIFRIAVAIIIPGSRIEYSQYGQLLFTFIFFFFLLKKNMKYGLFLIPIYIFFAIKGQSQFMTIATALVSIIFILLNFRIKYRFIFYITILIFILSTNYISQLFTYFIEFVQDREQSNSFRLEKMAESLQVFKDHILFGSGPSSEMYVSKSLATSENTYTQSLAELGLFGFSIFIYLHLFVFYKLTTIQNKIKLISRQNLFILICLIAFFGPISWTSGLFAPIIWISVYMFNVIINKFKLRLIENDLQ